MPVLAGIGTDPYGAVGNPALQKGAEVATLEGNAAVRVERSAEFTGAIRQVGSR